MMKTWKFLIYLIPAALLLTSCSGKAAEETAGQEVQEAGKNTEAASKEGDAAEKETKEPEILHFVDVYQNPYQVEINPNVEKHDYKDDSFVHNGDRLSYEGDSNYTYRLGVDVSEHQGYVDWQALKDSGLVLPYRPEGFTSSWAQYTVQLPVGIDNLALLIPYRCPRFIDARRVGSGNFKSRIHTALLGEKKTHTAFFHDRC